jgi:hypothetical protein
MFEQFLRALGWTRAFATAAHALADGSVREKDSPIQVSEVAPGLFFQYRHQQSNSAWRVTRFSSPQRRMALQRLREIHA